MTPMLALPPGLDPDLLRSFVLIAEGGSFTRAAQLVGRTQSAVSMQIRRLEEALGQPLLVRGVYYDQYRPHTQPSECHSAEEFTEEVAEWLSDVRTAPIYRLYSINDVHPGMFEVESGGVSVAGELYRVPSDVLRRVEESR